MIYETKVIECLDGKTRVFELEYNRALVRIWKNGKPFGKTTLVYYGDKMPKWVTLDMIEGEVA